VTIRATAVYRGTKQERYEVSTGVWAGDCGVDFETGEDYLVYAWRDQTGRLVTNRCMHTAAVEYAGPDLRILNGEPPSPDDLLDQASYKKKFWAEHKSSVCGRVVRSDGRPINAIVILRRKRHDGFPPKGYPTDVGWADPKPDGSFCVEGVFRRGGYWLSAKDNDPSTDIQFAGTLSNIHLEEGKSTAELNLVLHRDLLYWAGRHVSLLIASSGTVIVIAVLSWLFVHRRRVPV
jgi:hypothetical protein